MAVGASLRLCWLALNTASTIQGMHLLAMFFFWTGGVFWGAGFGRAGVLLSAGAVGVRGVGERQGGVWEVCLVASRG